MKTLLFVLISAFVTTVSAAEPKNVIFLIADDLGLQLGCYGDTGAKTPNIDALAKAGTRFTNGFASVASCSPSRATMLTGQPTHQCGQYGLAHADHNFSSFKKTVSLPTILNKAGYKTAVISKLHVQPKEVYPFGEEIQANGKNVEAIAAAAKKFITAAEGKPFFLHVGYTDPHRAGKGFGNDGKNIGNTPKTVIDPKSVTVPAHLPDTQAVREDLADYYQAVARLDHGIGLMMKVLDETKVKENTLVFFFSDNGIPFPGAKTTLYDAGVRLPLIVLKPGQKPGQVTDAFASWTDLAPTVLDWAGLSKPDTMKGASLLPVIDGKSAGPDAVYGSHQFHEITMYYPMRMVRTKQYKLIQNLAHKLEVPSASDLWGSPTWQSILKSKDTMMGQRSVQAFLHRPAEELYDICADPNETKNLIDSKDHEHVRDELRKKLHDWRKATNDSWLIKDQHE